MRARNKKPYTLINMLVFSTAVFSALGIYTGIKYYSGTQFSTASNMPLCRDCMTVYTKISFIII